MKNLFLSTLFFLSFLSCYAQIKPYSIDVYISGRVDTTDAEVNAVYHLFKNYMESRPDSIYDNPFWNEREKKANITGNVAIFYTAFYNLQATPKTIFGINWKPYILTIVKKNESKYLLRIALIQDTSIYTSDKILTILNINAIKEKNHWVLENTFSDIVNSWNSKQYKNINYVYPKTHVFNDSLAQKSEKYCDSIAALLHINMVDTFSFYICDNPDEMGLLFGYEFFYLEYTTGITVLWRNQIFSAKGNEYYPHEFFHMVSKAGKGDTSNYLIQEGLACFLGERNTDKYEWRIVHLAQDYNSNKPTYTLTNLLMDSAQWNGYQTAYPTGSIIAEIVYDHKGHEGIRKLSEANTHRPENIYKTINTITGLNKIQFEKEFRKKLGLHLKNFDFNK